MPDSPRVPHLLHQTGKGFTGKKPASQPVFPDEEGRTSCAHPGTDIEGRCAESGEGDKGTDYEVATPYCRQEARVSLERRLELRITDACDALDQRNLSPDQSSPEEDR